MAHQVKAHPTKIAGRLSHHGLIQLLIQELLKRRNMAWTHFLFWNGFETGLQPEEKGKSLLKKSTTLRSGKRKRRAISPATVDQPSSPSRTKQAKRNLDFSEKGKEIPAQSENILNFPYSDSEEEREEGADLEKYIVVENEELPSPTPKDQCKPVEKASSSKPRAQRVNQLVMQVYELKFLEREIKRSNAMLTKRNKELHNSVLEMRGMYVLLKRRNLKYM